MISSLMVLITILGFTKSKGPHFNSELQSDSQNNLYSNFVFASNSDLDIDYLSPFSYKPFRSNMNCVGFSISYPSTTICKNDITEQTPTLMGGGIAYIYETTGSISFKSDGSGTILADQSKPGGPYDVILVGTSGCRDTFEISVAGTSVYAGFDSHHCINNSAFTTSFNPSPNVGLWSSTLADGNPGGVFSNPSDPNSNFTGEPGNDYILTWTVTDAICGPISDQFTLSIETAGSNYTAITYENFVMCGLTSVNLSASSPPPGGSGSWSIVNGDGNGSFLIPDPNSANFVSTESMPDATFNGTVGQSYDLRWSISNNTATCNSDVLTTVYIAPNIVADAGTDQLVCGEPTTILDANSAEHVSGIWSIVSGDGLGILADATDPESKFWGTPGETYTLSWTLGLDLTRTFSNCTPDSDEVEIRFDSIPAANAGLDQNICLTTSTLSIALPAGATVLWEETQGGGSILDPTNSTTTISNLQRGTNEFSVTQSLGSCQSVDLIKVFVDSIAPTFILPKDTTVYRKDMCAVDTMAVDTGIPTNLDDNCDNNPISSYIDSFSTIDCPGNILISRTWSVTDNTGNVSVSAIQTITVRDTTPPTFTFPRDTTIILDASCSESAALAGLASATSENDHCTISQTATYTDNLTYQCGSNYTITRTWELVDDCANYAQHIQTIEVQDTSKIDFVAPPDTTIYITDLCVFDTTIMSTLAPTQMMNNCSNTNRINSQSWAVTQQLNANSSYALGDNNFAIPFAMETGTDVTAPQTLFELGDVNNGVEVIINNGELQVYHVAPFGNAESLFAPIPITPTTDYVFILYRNTTGDWFLFLDEGTVLEELTSNHRIKGINHPGALWNNGAIGIGSRQGGSAISDLIVTSSFGGTTTYSQLFLYLNSQLVPFEKTGYITYSYADIVVPGCGAELEIRRVWSMEDGCAAVTIDTQFIEIKDTIRPRFTAPAQDTFWYTDDCLLDTIPDLSTIMITPNICSSTANSITYTDLRIDAPRSAIRTWRVTDDCGNYSEADQTLIFLDTIAPVLTCPSDQAGSTDGNCEFVIPDYSPLVSVIADLDNCPDSELTYAQIPAIGTVIDAGIHELAIIATDAFNNSDTCFFNLDLDYSISTVKVLCGTSLVNQSTLGAGNRTNNYSCIPFNTPGQEVYYQVDVPPGNYVMNVVIDSVFDANDQVIDIFWMGNSCPINNCATYTTYNIASQTFANGTNKERFVATGPDTYYIVLDSRYDGITSYDIEFECFDSTIELDKSDDCVADTDNDGVVTSVKGVSFLELDRCQTVAICEEIYISNKFAGEWMDSLQMILGDCYTNIRSVFPSGPGSGYYNAGAWTDTYDASSNTIFWEFDDDAGIGRGDGFDTTYGCDSSSAHVYTFCFTADIAEHCSEDRLLNITIVVADDEMDGFGKSTGPGTDVALLDDFTIRNTLEIEKDSLGSFFNCDQDTLHVRNPYQALDYVWSTLDGNIITRSDSASIIVDKDGTYVVSANGSGCNNSDTIVLSNDNIPPTFTKPRDTTIAQFAGCFVDKTTLALGNPIDVMDNSGDLLVATYSDMSTDGCEGNMTITRTWVVSDACNNVSTDVQIITVVDTIAPEFNTPSDITVYYDNDCNLDTTTNNTLLPTQLQDYCDGTLIAIYKDTILSTTSIERIWSLEDDCGNLRRDTQRITVSDTIAPILTCPPQLEFLAGATTCQRILPNLGSLVTYSDNCDSGLSITQSPAPGTILEAGLWPITMSVTDLWGNIGTCTFDILVIANNDFEPIICGASYSGLSTAGSSNFYNNVGCLGPDTHGGDMVFQLTVPQGNYLLDVTLDNVSDITDNSVELKWMSQDCTLSSCPLDRFTYIISDSEFDKSNTKTATMAAPGPATYYLVIDSRVDGIDNFDVSFSCLRTGLLFDDTNCDGDTNSDGINLWVNDTTIYEVENCQQDLNICQEIWVKNTTSVEWLDSVVISLGSGYENIRVSSTDPTSYDNFVEQDSIYYAISGGWRQNFNNSNNTVIFDFDNRLPFCYSCGDGFGSGFSCEENKTFHYTFCFQADIASDANGSNDLNIVTRIIDDGIGDSGQTTVITGDVKTLDNVTLTPFNVNAGLDADICAGDSIQLNGSGSGTPTWRQNGSISDINDLNTWVSPTVNTDYILEETNTFGCLKMDTVRITVRSSPISGISGDPIFNCSQDTLSVANVTSGVNYQWATINGSILSSHQSTSIVIGLDGTYVLTSTNLNNCVTVDSFTTTDDAIEPTFVLPRDTTLYHNATCINDTSTALMMVPTAPMDNYFPSTAISHTDIITYQCSGSYTIERKWTIKDGCRNSTTQSQYIEVIDTVGPSFTWPSDVDLVSDEFCQADTSISNTGSTLTFLEDNCDIAPALIRYYDVITNVCAIGGYTITRNWQAADDCGNITTRQQYINVIDNTPPTFTIPANDTLYIDEFCLVDTSTTALGVPIYELDNCSIEIYESIDLSGFTPDLLISHYQHKKEALNLSLTLPFIYTSGSDINSAQTLFEFGGTTNGLHVRIFQGNIEVIYGTKYGVHTIVISAPITPSTEYANILHRTASGNWYLFMNVGDNVDSLSRAHMVTGTNGSGNLWGTGRIGIGQIGHDTKGSGGLFTGITPSQPLLIYTGDNLDPYINAAPTTNTSTYQDIRNSNCSNGSYYFDRVWSFSDACGNVVRDTQQIWVLDTIPPTFTTPDSITLYLDNNCTIDSSPVAAGNVTNVQDNCTPTTALQATFVNIDTIGDCTINCVIARQWSLSDACGNTTIDTQYISILDTISPVVDALVDFDVFASETCDLDTIGNPIILNISDNNCGATADLSDLTVSYKDSIALDCPGTFDIFRTWTVTDQNGNSTTQSQILHVQDNVSPTFTVPADIEVFRDSLCNVDTDTSAIIGVVTDAFDGCAEGLVAIPTDVIIPGCSMSSYTINRTWTLTDSCGNSTAKLQVITVSDIIKPTFSAPDHISLYVDSLCKVNDLPTELAGDVTDEWDNCQPNIQATFIDNTITGCSGAYTIERTWSLVDSCGNAADDQVQIITVLDSIKPWFTTPDSITLYLDNNCTIDSSPVAAGNVTNVQDNCTPTTALQATFVNIDTIGDCTINCVIARQWSLSDACGNTTIDTQYISILDTISPVVDALVDFDVFASETCDLDTIGNPIILNISDNNCGATADLSDLTVSYKDSIALDCPGTFDIFRTWTVTDQNGNSTTQSQILHVQDNVSPTFTVPANIEVFRDSLCNVDTDTSAIIGVVTDAFDGCAEGLVAIPTDVIIPGCSMSSYTINRTWTLTDSCGNSTAKLQVITVSDIIKPTFSAPDHISLYVDSLCKVNDLPTELAGDVTDEWDNCQPNIQATFIDNTITGCSGAYTIERTWSLVDSCGNAADDQVQIITVLDSIKPWFTTPDSITLYLDNNCTIDSSPVAAGNVTNVQDNCTPTTALQATFVNIDTIGDCTINCVIARQWSLSDACGNTTIDTQYISILDTISPVVDALVDFDVFASETCDLDTIGNPIILNISDNNCGATADLSDLTVSYKDSIALDCPGTFDIFRTWTVTDQNGNSTTQSQILHVQDNVSPTFTVPANIEVFRDSLCNVDTDTSAIIGVVTDAFDGCSKGLVAIPTDVIIPGCSMSSYTINRTWTLTDSCGNSTAKLQVITVSDIIKPTFSAPDHISLYVDSLCKVNDLPTELAGDVTDEWDNCQPNIQATFIDNTITGCSGAYTIERTWSLVDSCGNAADDQVQIITVLDSIKPWFTTPDSITLYLDNNCTIDSSPVAAGNVTNVQDNCTPTTALQATFVNIDTIGDCTINCVIARQWSLSDACGNTTIDTQYISILDTISPVVDALVDFDVFASETCDLDTIGNPIILNISDNNCGATADLSDLTVSYKDSIALDCPGTFDIFRTWTVTDQNGNSTTQSQILHVQDNVSPTFTVPADIEVFRDSLCNVDTDTSAIIGVVTDAFDGCAEGLVAIPTDVIIPGCSMSSYTINRTWTLTDSCGNSTAKLQVITVSDIIKPTFSAPDHISLYVDSLCKVNDLPTELAGDVTDEWDNCQPNIQATFIDNTITGCSGAYTIERTWSLVDACGNAADDQVQIITVLDSIKPWFTTPDSITLYLDNNCTIDSSPVAAGNVTNVQDNCTPTTALQATFVNIDTIGDCTINCVIARQWSLSDACGNTTIDTQYISILDTISPVVDALVDFDVFASETCDLDTIGNPIILNISDNNCGATADLSDLTVSYKDSIALDCPGTFDIFRTWTVTDQNGNSTTQSQILHVQDNVSPTFTVPADIEVFRDSLCNVDTDTSAIIGVVTDAFDGCAEGLVAIPTDVIIPGCSMSSYTINRTWTLTDSCGNSTAKLQVITVSDIIKPTFSAPDHISLYVDSLCKVNDLPTELAGDVTDEWDNCQPNIQATFIDNTITGCSGAYTIERTWSLVDSCGNAADDQVQIITVLDSIKPWFTTPDSITLYLDNNCTIDSSPVAAGNVTNVQDNCTPTTALQATFVNIDTIGDCTINCVIARQWSLSDACGNTTIDTQYISILDTISPVVDALVDFDVFASETCDLDTIGNPIILNISDNNCGATADLSDLTVSYKDSIALDCPGTFDIFRTWTVTDQNGNSTTQSQILHVQDNVSPTFTVPANIEVFRDSLCNVDTDTSAIIGVVTDAFDGCAEGLVAIPTDVIIPGCSMSSYTINRTWTLTDSCGNSTAKLQVITVSDIIKPTFSAPDHISLYVDSLCKVNDLPTELAGDVTDEWDNCQPNIQATFIDNTITGCSGAYTIERTWSLVDSCGNAADDQIQIITVLDTISPTFDTPNAVTIYLDEFNNLDSSTTALGTITNIFDGCTNNVSVTYTDSIVNIRSAQILDEVYRIWSIEDDCGNTDVHIQQITLIDTIAPTFVTPAIVEIDCEFTPPIDTVVFTDVNDVVDIQMIEMIVDTPCIDKHTIVRTWTATDGVGNQSIVDQIYSVTSCNVIVNATLSDESPCTGEFVRLNGDLSHPIAAYTYYPQWFYRSISTDPWTEVLGGAQENVIFPAYTFRSGEYKLVFSTDANHLDPVDCQYTSNVLNLNVHNEEPILSTSAVICDGELYSIGDSTFTREGNYNVVFQNRYGCDSIVALHLDVIEIAIIPIDTTICRGDYYETATGTRHYNQGVIRDTFTTANHGCDSILLVDISIAHIHLVETTEYICQGDAFMFYGNALTTPGLYIETFQSQFNCDSMVTLNLVVNQPQEHDLNVTICPGETYVFDALSITADSEFSRPYTGVNGCDSIVHFKLTVAEEVFSTIYDTTCYQVPYYFGNDMLVQSGVYRDTVPTADNCNNITELHLYMRAPIVKNFDVRICAGEVHEFKNKTYDASAMLIDTLVSSTLCDSIVQINLIVGDRQSTIAPPQTICAGDSVQIGNNYVKTSGTYNIGLANYRGCLDSTVTYNITVLEEKSFDENLVICASDSVFLDGAFRNVSGVYVSTFSSSLTDCDSVVTTNLIVEDDVELWTEDVNICLGDTFDIIVDGADNLTWTNSNLLSCTTCPNPSGLIDVTTTFTATAAGCAGKQESIDVTVNVFNEVQIEVLTKDTTLTLGESIVLDAFVTDPYTPITWFDQMGNELCVNCTRFEIIPEQNMIYYAEANSKSGCTVRDEVIVNLKSACTEGEIIVPNFITPNADGINDEIKVKYTGIHSISKMRIFNRWGQLVFHTDDVDNNRWNGLVDGKAANTGVYVYYVEYQCLNNEIVYQKGNITLMK